MKVDLISFPWSPRTPKSESIWSPGGHHKLTLSSSPNPALPKCVGFNLYLSLGQSVIVAWWRMMGIHGTGPQSTSLVLHAFHVCSIIFLIHVCISKNDNECTSWRNINSSNVSNTIMIKNDFTFESNVSYVVVSEKVMSSSFSPSWLQVVLDLLQCHSMVCAFMLEHRAMTMLHGHNQQCSPSLG